jgi:hypothetical protein
MLKDGLGVSELQKKYVALCTVSVGKHFQFKHSRFMQLVSSQPGSLQHSLGRRLDILAMLRAYNLLRAHRQPTDMTSLRIPHFAAFCNVHRLRGLQ